MIRVAILEDEPAVRHLFEKADRSAAAPLQATTVEPLAQPLSEREHDVLRLITICWLPVGCWS